MNPFIYTFCALILNCLLLTSDIWCPIAISKIVEVVDSSGITEIGDGTMLNNEALELLVRGYETTRDAEGNSVR